MVDWTKQPGFHKALDILTIGVRRYLEKEIEAELAQDKTKGQEGQPECNNEHMDGCHNQV